MRKPKNSCSLPRVGTGCDGDERDVWTDNSYVQYRDCLQTVFVNLLQATKGTYLIITHGTSLVPVTTHDEMEEDSAPSSMKTKGWDDGPVLSRGPMITPG